MLNTQMYACATNNEKATYINNNKECIEKEKMKWVFFFRKRAWRRALRKFIYEHITNTFISSLNSKVWNENE